jgi:hypothetical protein
MVLGISEIMTKNPKDQSEPLARDGQLLFIVNAANLLMRSRKATM